MSFLDELKGSTAAVKLTFDGRGGTYGMSGSDTDHAGSEWVAHIYRATGGHLKFNGKGNPPDRKMGAVFPTDQAPTRASLGDLDKSKWPPSKFNQGEVDQPAEVSAARGRGWFRRSLYGRPEPAGAYV